MHMQVHFLFPFDLGLELDFTGQSAQEMFKDISSRKVANLFFENETYTGAEIATQIYKFGVGLIQISFSMESDVVQAARLSCYAEKLNVGKTPVVRYCQGLVDGVIQTASKYASYRYEKRLEEEDLYPVFVMGESQH